MIMPVIFVGHGSPMNAIEDNSFTRQWKELGQRIAKPKAILVVSAHWYTKDTRINNDSAPKTTHDMYGFPRELYEIIYRAPGSPTTAARVKEHISKPSYYDNQWGIDHGAWSVLVHMYPKMDIPVFQLSIDASASAQVHYQIGKELSFLRQEGVLILGSGNIVHNLRIVDFDMDGGYDWAYDFDSKIKEAILKKDHEPLIHYESYGSIAHMAVPTPDHYYPLLYVLGATKPEDKITVFNEDCVLGTISMTGYVFES